MVHDVIEEGEAPMDPRFWYHGRIPRLKNYHVTHDYRFTRGILGDHYAPGDMHLCMALYDSQVA